jgi:hypothetical protein
LRQIEHRGHEFTGDVAIEQPVAVFAEYGGVLHLIVDREADEPAEQQIVIELLHQLPLRADRKESLQQERTQQPFRGIPGRPSRA